MQPWRLATFNVESLDLEPADPDRFARRVAALRPLLEEMNADVLCLQEVNAQHLPGEKARRFLALDKLISGTAYARYSRATSVQPEINRPSDVHNLAILSRWPIRRQGQVHHDHVGPIAPSTLRQREPSDAVKMAPLCFDRPILTAAIEHPDGQLLHVMNLHLRAPRAVPVSAARRGAPLSSRDWAVGFYLAALKRQGQALEARLATEALFDAETDPLIAVCGDLNSDSYETPAKLLRAAPEDSDGRLDRARTLEALEMRLTEDQRYSVIHDGRPLLLDHILASPALARACSGFTILNAGLPDEYSSAETAEASFHAPLIARFGKAQGP